jgi:hypothetical protein
VCGEPILAALAFARPLYNVAIQTGLILATFNLLNGARDTMRYSNGCRWFSCYSCSSRRVSVRRPSNPAT